MLRNQLSTETVDKLGLTNLEGNSRSRFEVDLLFFAQLSQSLHPLPPYSHKDREDDRAQEKPDETEGGETAQHPKRHEQKGNAGSTADHHGTNQVIDRAYHEGAPEQESQPRPGLTCEQ